MQAYPSEAPHSPPPASIPISTTTTTTMSDLTGTSTTIRLLFLLSTVLLCITSSISRSFLLVLLPLLVLVVLLRRLLATRQIYLLDYSCLKPPGHLRVPIAGLLEHLHLLPCFDDESVAFMSKIINSSGLGDETSFPPSLRYLPPSTHHRDSIEEARLLLFPALDDLFRKTQISPSSIDILVLNCSGFCPSPSLTSVVINHYAMREDIKSFNISGMGCSAGVISLDVARAALSSRPNSYAVVLSTEILSTGWYAGRDRRKLLINCIFRMGCAVAMLTNRPEERRRAKYKLARLLRTQRAFEDVAYRSATREEDADGITGFSIERDLLRVAREVLRANVAALGASVLPLREKLRYAVFVARRVVAKEAEGSFVPDFSGTIQHYCLPASGLAVIREIGRGLGLRDREVEPALAAFQRFGNQSSSSLWYQMAYMEARGRVRVGDWVWQLGMGTGPKSNTAVWECVREICAGEEEEKGPWWGSLDRYPMGAVAVEQKNVAAINDRKGGRKKKNGY